MERQLYTGRLEAKRLLSAPSQCFHLEFSIDGLEDFAFTPGQFISTVAEDKNGKQQTRAYSLASAPRGNRFDLCLNRVENGFFSNLLCDLEPGQSVPFHGPHGMFTLREPLSDSILIATDTGIAPMRGFLQQLFPEGAPARTQSQIWLLNGAENESGLYYDDYFETLASAHENFHYRKTLSNPPAGWRGESGCMQDVVRDVVADTVAARSPGPTAAGTFDIHAYLCGLNEMVSANRALLKELGWERKQIVFERYD